MELDSTLQLYFLENATLDISPSTPWEAHKAVLCGRCIALASAMKDTMAAKLRVEGELRALELSLQVSPSLPLLKKIVCLRMTLKDLAVGQVEKALRRLKQLYYDKGNKAHSLLARKLAERSNATMPHRIKNGEGCLISHPHDIVQTFAEFNTRLCNNPEIPHNPPSPELTD